LIYESANQMKIFDTGVLDLLFNALSEVYTRLLVQVVPSLNQDRSVLEILRNE